MPRRRPNVLIIHAHDLGRHSEVYGYGTRTPALRRFAEGATVFNDAWSTAPTCSPSRAALLTGRYPHEVGMLGLAHLGFSLERRDLHLSRRLKDEGYRTCLCGVQHEVPDHSMLDYDSVIGADPEAPYRPDFDPVSWDRENGAAVRAFLSETAADAPPWFLFWGLFEPHRPFGEVPAAAQRSVPAGLPDAPAIRGEYAAFDAAVERVDTIIGSVLDALAKRNRDEDTIVVVTSDHGIDFPRYKCTLSPGGLGVHLIMRLPGQTTGVRSDVPVSTVDVVPTILEAIGIDEASDQTPWRGVSLLPLWDTPTRPVRRYTFAEINYHVAYDPARSVYDGRYHYVEYHHDDDGAVLPNIGDSATKALLFPDKTSRSALSPTLLPPRRGLYDLWFDPLQNNNLVDTESEQPTVHRLRETLSAWMSETDDPLVDGAVPAPDGAAVASRDAYSSTAADVIMASRRGAHQTGTTELHR